LALFTAGRFEPRVPGEQERAVGSDAARMSGSGKSMLASAFERALFERGCEAFVIDGDDFRKTVSADLGFSAADRSENIRRAAHVASLFARAGILAITAFISPYRDDRRKARQVVTERSGAPFVEIYLSTPLAVYEQRDPKNLYARARSGELKDFTGVSAPFEIPEQPDLAIDTSQIDVERAVTLVLDHVRRQITRKSCED
jgi:adenylyl-sulfate kinase